MINCLMTISLLFPLKEADQDGSALAFGPGPWPWLWSNQFRAPEQMRKCHLALSQLCQGQAFQRDGSHQLSLFKGIIRLPWLN